MSNKRNRRIRGVRVAGLIAVTCIATSAGCGNDDPRASARLKETVRLGLAVQSSSALAIIASEKRYFSDEGLDIQMNDYISGKRALDALLAEEVDVATTSQVPVIFAAFEREDFSTVATIASVTNVERIVARKDQGILEPLDLRGRRIATQKGSAVHFFLHMFLLKNGISENEVELSYMKGEQLPEALANGEIDAFSMREPYVSQAVELLGDKAIVFAEPGVYYRIEHLVVLNQVIQNKPQAVRKMIRALLRAEEIARIQPEAAQRIVANSLGISQSAVRQSWPESELHVSLDQSILSSMEDQARWVMEAGLTDQTEIPNYLRYVFVDAIQEEKPEAVTIIR